MTDHSIVPQAWIDDNRAYFEYLGNEYAAAKTIGARRTAIGMIVFHMVTALENLTVLDSRTALARDAVEHLTHMLTDLNKGLDHPLAKPVGVGGSGLQSAAEREIRIWAITASSILRSAGVTAGETNNKVANALTKAGLSGRQRRKDGAGFSPGTVGRWFNALGKPGSEADVIRVAAAIQSFHADHASDQRGPRARAEAFVNDESGLLREKLRVAPFKSVGFG